MNGIKTADEFYKAMSDARALIERADAYIKGVERDAIAKRAVSAGGDDKVGAINALVECERLGVHIDAARHAVNVAAHHASWFASRQSD